MTVSPSGAIIIITLCAYEAHPNSVALLSVAGVQKTLGENLTHCCGSDGRDSALTLPQANEQADP